MEIVSACLAYAVALPIELKKTPGITLISVCKINDVFRAIVRTLGVNVEIDKIVRLPGFVSCSRIVFPDSPDRDVVGEHLYPVSSPQKILEIIW
jgi:hypothetical protein